MFAMASCTPEETPEPEIPTTTTPTAPTPPQPTINGVNGVLVALDLDFSITQMGISVPLNTEMGIAAFYNTPGDTTMVDAGTVKINNVSLTKNANNSYLVTAGIPSQEPSTLNYDGGNTNWSVSGAGSIPAITGNYAYNLPSYSGTIPTDINKANGLTLNLSGTMSNTDSVYVVIISGSTSFMKSYAPSASVSISASDLSGLTASSATSPAYIEIVPWKVIGYQTISGKTFAFVNERAYVRTVNIN